MLSFFLVPHPIKSILLFSCDWRWSNINEKYEYRSADSLLKDFELVKTNAIKFNGVTSMLAAEATAIYDTAKSMVDKSRAELSHLEQAVADQINTQSNKKKNTSKKSG